MNNSNTKVINNTDIKPGMLIRVHQKIKDIGKDGKEKQRIQVFEGTVIAKKSGKNQNATFTVRKVSASIGIEKIFPLYMPAIEKIELVKTFKTRRAKLYFKRNPKSRKLKEKKIQPKK
jgi:large subunit ribosomal protein L19